MDLCESNYGIWKSIFDLWESISSAELRVKNRISIVILLVLPLKRSSILEPEFRTPKILLKGFKFA